MVEVDDYPVNPSVDYYNTEASKAIRISNMYREVPPSPTRKQYWNHVVKTCVAEGRPHDKLLDIKDRRKQVNSFRGVVRFVRGGDFPGDLNSSDLRSWECFVILSGWYPANASDSLIQSIDNHIQAGRIVPAKTILNRAKLEDLYQGFYKDKVFAQVCLYSVLHTVSVQERTKNPHFYFTKKDFRRFADWVEIVITRWDSFMPAIADTLARYLIFNPLEMRFEVTALGHWAVTGAASSICVEPRQSQEIDEARFDPEDTPEEMHAFYREVAQEFSFLLNFTMHKFLLNFTMHKFLLNYTMRTLDYVS